MGTWMNGEILMKHDNLKKSNFIEDITDADQIHAKRVCKDFKIKNLVENHNFYLKSATLLLADVSENFIKISLKIYHLASAKFISAPGLTQQEALKKMEKNENY